MELIEEISGCGALGRSYSATLLGLDAVRVEIQAQITSALKRFVVVGLPDSALREAKERVRCAIEQSGFDFPRGEVVVSLAPADLPKNGSSFDLAIALAILAASGVVEPSRLTDFLALGELGLDGTVKPLRGSFGLAFGAAESRGPGLRVLAPLENLAELSLIRSVRSQAVRDLRQAVLAINSPEEYRPSVVAIDPPVPCEQQHPVTLSDIVGQPVAKRTLEIVAAGGHNLLMVGPPGAGKSMLASALRSIMPPMTEEERLEVLRIHSAFSLWTPNGGEQSLEPLIAGIRPFRTPHHTCSSVALVGGGSDPTPGEISLAHNGVLFLDEFNEFKRESVEALREPLETQSIKVVRTRYRINFKADFLLVAAINPCPCGMYGDKSGRCRCAPAILDRYLVRLSGPLLDRFDLAIRVSPVSSLFSEKLLEAKTDNCEEDEIVARVTAARGIQHARGQLNSRMSSTAIRSAVKLSRGCLAMLDQATNTFHLSNRAQQKVIKVALTIADLEGSNQIAEQHLAEALSYRVTVR